MERSYMHNDIINLLNIEDKDIVITKILIHDRIKEIYLEKAIKPEFCPSCFAKMHSKGKYTRTVNHPVLQDGFQLKLIVSQRKWRCTNPQCNLYFNDQFNFVSKYKQSSNITPYMILNEMKNINITTRDIANKYHISDTSVHYIFLQYLDIKRLPLPEILSVDEVYLNIDYKHKYALILMDFQSGDIVDILPNRWETTTNHYFLSIPIEERRRVKYLVCDMYNPYINYTKRYFPNSITIIDSFHIISWLNHKIIIYLNALKKKFQDRDRKNHMEILKKRNKIPSDDLTSQNIPISKEVYLLNNYRWLLLKNQDHIDYQIKAKYNHKLKMYLNTYDYEKMFFEIDDHLKIIRKLKEKYIKFNSSHETDQVKLNTLLNQLIDEYSKSAISIFREFSVLLDTHKQEIINSFIYINDVSGKQRRISNGPIEGFNRIPKDFKRNSRGLGNFEYARTRLIWSNRKNEAVLSTPKSKEEVYRHRSKK